MRTGRSRELGTPTCGILNPGLATFGPTQLREAPARRTVAKSRACYSQRGGVISPSRISSGLTATGVAMMLAAGAFGCSQGPDESGEATEPVTSGPSRPPHHSPDQGPSPRRATSPTSPSGVVFSADRSRVVIRDATQDVWRLGRSGVKADQRLSRGADVTNAVIEYTADALVLQFEFAALLPIGRQEINVDIERLTMRGSYPSDHLVTVSSSAARRDGYLSQYGSECRTASGDYDYAAATVTIRLPSSCLGDLKWVKVADADAGLWATEQGGFSDDLFTSRAYRRQGERPIVHPAPA